MEVAEGNDIRFVTGDPEFDELERRLAEGTITDEELDEVLDSWEGKKPEKRKQEQDKAAEIEAFERRLEDELGDGFVDSR